MYVYIYIYIFVKLYLIWWIIDYIQNQKAVVVTTSFYKKFFFFFIPKLENGEFVWIKIALEQNKTKTKTKIKKKTRDYFNNLVYLSVGFFRIKQEKQQQTNKNYQ